MYTPPPIIKKLGEWLRDELPPGLGLLAHLKAIEALRYELAEATTDQLRLLHEKENQMLYPKDKDLTELDRSVRLKASVALIRRDHEMLLRLEDLVKDRLELGRLLLTYK